MGRKETNRLLRKIKKGDLKAFEAMVSGNMERTYRLAFRMMANKADAEDVVQDSWVKIWQNISSFRNQADLSSWVYRIVTNTCLDHLKKRMVRLDHFREPVNGLHTLADHEHSPETQYVNNEQLNLLRRMTASLPPRQKIVFILRDMEGLSADEVAEILNMDKDLIKSHLAHARKALRIKAGKLKKEEERYYDMRKN